MRHLPLLFTLCLTVSSIVTVAAATIELPPTGQTSCFDETGAARSCTGTGEDGEYRAGIAWPNPRFSVAASGQCITDNLTGLMWTQDANLAGLVTWAQALEYANNLELCGYDDWRMPNRKEMLSLIINADVVDLPTWLAGEGFINLYTYYWTSTTGTNTNRAWFANLYAGAMERSARDSSTEAVWPVRGGQ